MCIHRCESNRWLVSAAMGVLVAAALLGCGTSNNGGASGGNAGAEDDPSRLGLVPSWQLERYVAIEQRPTPRDGGYITRFGRSTLAQADVVLLGALTGIHSSHPVFELADIAVLQVLKPEGIRIDDRERDRNAIPSVASLYTPEKGFFSDMDGEQVFALRRWNVRGSYHVVTNFAVESERRDEQLNVVRELIELEGIADVRERKRRIKERCFQGVTHEDEWVANVWALQLANLCADFPLLFDDDDFDRLRELEVTLVTERPTHTGAIRGITGAISNLVHTRYKREWTYLIRAGTQEERIQALEMYLSVAQPSYHSAFDFYDRNVVNTLFADSDDPVLRTGLRRLDDALRGVLESEDREDGPLALATAIDGGDDDNADDQ